MSKQQVLLVEGAIYETRIKERILRRRVLASDLTQHPDGSFSGEYLLADVKQRNIWLTLDSPQYNTFLSTSKRIIDVEPIPPLDLVVEYDEVGREAPVG